MDFQLTHPEKVLYPADGITKLQVAEYYAAVADWILPYIANRPVSLVRCPQGIDHVSFFQKHLSEKEKGSQFLFTKDIDKGKHPPYIYLKNEQGIYQLVQRSVLELHLWGCKIDKPEKPDWMIFDLDPAPDVAWAEVVKAAFDVKTQLEELGLQSFVKTTGGKGLHVTVPLKRSHSWDEMYEFTQLFAKYMVEQSPKAYIATMSKAKRIGKIFIDYLRNHRTATAIAPYSTRARAGCPIATPIAWDELNAKLKPESFNIETVPKRVGKLRGDPWEGFWELSQNLPG